MTPAQCPYRCDCWLEYVGWWNPKPETCEHETRCDTDTCPRYQRMEREHKDGIVTGIGRPSILLHPDPSDLSLKIDLTDREEPQP